MLAASLLKEEEELAAEVLEEEFAEKSLVGARFCRVDDACATA